jgi:hypothetical protein
MELTMALERFALTPSENLPAAILVLDGLDAAPGPCLRLLDEASGREVVAQADPLEPGRIYLPTDGIEAGHRRRYRLLEAKENGGGVQGVEVSDAGSTINVDVGGERFTRYHYLPEEAPARPYFYPALAHAGVPVTRNYPMADVEGESKDHPHHRSLWVAHGDVNGTDNWSEEKGHGRTEHLAFEGRFSGPVAGGFREVNRWVTAAGEPLLSETRDVRIYAAEGPERILDLTLRFTPVAGDVTFGDTKEGGLISVRVATSMDGDKGGTIHNSEGGIGEKRTWGKTAAWCDYYGPSQGRVYGIALMDHPSNPRYPTYWHVRDYGLMTANPFGHSYYYNDKGRNGSLVLPAGKTTQWKFRLVAHPGTTEEARIAERYAAFAAPVAVEIE